MKGLLLRAQQLHPESQKLCLTFFQIELENKREADESLALQHAQIVYTNGKKTFTNVTFFIDMLNIVDKFSYANSIQQMILHDLREMFQHEEIMWHTLAQRELNGLSTNQFIKLENDGNAMNEDMLSAHRKRIEKCVEIYQEAVQVVSTAKIWSYYINAMLALNEDKTIVTTLVGLKRFCLSQAFEGANNSNQMSETHYLQYIELLYSSNPKDEHIEQVFQKATKLYGTSENIWLQYLRYYIQANNFKKLKDIFKTAKLQLGATMGAEVWELYLIYLKYVQSNEANSEFERLILELACQPHANFNVLKAHILELLATTVSMKRARKTYQLFIKHFPSCYEVHEMMAELEAKQVKIKQIFSKDFKLKMLFFRFFHSFPLILAETRFRFGATLPRNVDIELWEIENRRLAKVYAF